MADEFSGEQKLRIILESIIRNVPKEEQSKKYGVSEEEFQKWHDHLIQNGGKLFESSLPNKKVVRHRKIKKSSGSRIILFFSILINLAFLVSIGYLISIHGLKLDNLINSSFDQSLFNKSKEDNGESFVVNETPSKDLNFKDVEPQISDISVKGIEEINQISNQIPESNYPKSDFFSNSNILPPLNNIELPKDVSFLSKSYDGRHVVYLLDVGTYVLDGTNAVQNFQKVKKGLISSIQDLSPNAYFNLVLFWNLREVSALGPTILKASKENKKYAIDWIESLGDTKESLKLERNQYYPKEVLYTKPPIGIVGPWYALTTAISFDPDLVFVISGNIPAFNRSEVPKSHYDGLGKINFGLVTSTSSVSPTVSPLIMETAMKWYFSVTPLESLPSNDSDVQKMALAKLGIKNDGSERVVYEELPWEKTFENFLSSLEVGFDQIPKTHFILNLPEYTSWPLSLSNSAKEFSESSMGSFQSLLSH